MTRLSDGADQASPGLTRAAFPIREKSANARFLGTRFAARGLRDEVERLLAGGYEVVLDFTGVEATQSFVDELVGPLVLRMGPDLLPRVVFKACSEELKAIVQFVVSDRLDQFNRLSRH